MSLAQWFADHAALYEGSQCHHRDTTFRYEPKNDPVALATARRKAEENSPSSRLIRGLKAMYDDEFLSGKGTW